MSIASEFEELVFVLKDFVGFERVFVLVDQIEHLHKNTVEITKFILIYWKEDISLLWKFEAADAEKMEADNCC